MYSVKRGIIAAGIASLALIGSTGTAASADDRVSPPLRPQVCETGTFYNETHSDRYVGDSSTRVYGSAGGVLSISKGITIQITGTLSGTVSADAGVVFAKVSSSVSLSVALSRSVTTTVGYSWTVPSDQDTGWVEMGAHGYSIDWEKGHYVSPCSWVKTGGGTGLVGVTSNVEFAHS